MLSRDSLLYKTLKLSLNRVFIPEWGVALRWDPCEKGRLTREGPTVRCCSVGEQRVWFSH